MQLPNFCLTTHHKLFKFRQTRNDNAQQIILVSCHQPTNHGLWPLLTPFSNLSDAVSTCFCSRTDTKTVARNPSAASSKRAYIPITMPDFYKIFQSSRDRGLAQPNAEFMCIRNKTVEETNFHLYCNKNKT